MSIESDVSFWKQLFEWTWAGVAAMVGLVWNGLNGKIKQAQETASAALTKADFRDYQDRADNSRKELREAIIDLYQQQGESTKLLSKIAGKLGVD